MQRSSIVSRGFIVLVGAVLATATGLSSTPTPATAAVQATGSCGPLTFDPPVDYAVGAGPQALAIGDLDGDGDDDVAVPNYDSANLTVFLSTPAGFVAAPGSPVSLSGSPVVARVGDFTGDTVADVAVAVGREVVVLHGNGDGTFSSETVTDVASALTPQGGALTSGFLFSAADLNGDSHADLAMTAVNARKVSVWLGDGSGSFTSVQELEEVGTWPMPVAIGDVNGDALPDFAVGDGWADTSAVGSFVYVFIQEPGGTFAAPVSYEAYKSVRSLAIGDLNGDTYADLIAPDYYGHGYHAFGGDDLGRVSIFFGNGDGTFGSPIHPLTGADNPDSVSVADFDGDGDLDIATSNQWNRFAAPGISLLPGDGAGGFAAPILYNSSAGTHPTALASGDFDANGMTDLGWLSNFLVNQPVTLKVMMNATDCDTTPPVITPLVSGTLGGGGWYVDDVSVEWLVTDDESSVGSMTGCGFTSITTDTAGTVMTCEATSGGGTSSQSVTIRRDSTPPDATAGSGPPPNASGWRKTNVTVVFIGTDALSGGVTCSPQVVLTAEGTGQSATGYCYDAAGNQSAPAVVSDINIDKTAPSVSIASPINGAVFNRNQVVVASYSCSDGLSGIATCSSTVASGQPLDTSKKANNAKLTVTSTDVAGNTTRTTVTYTVK